MKAPRNPPNSCLGYSIRRTLLDVSLLLSSLGLLVASLRITSTSLGLALGRGGLGDSAVGSCHLSLAVLEGLLVLAKDLLGHALAVHKSLLGKHDPQ